MIRWCLLMIITAALNEGCGSHLEPLYCGYDIQCHRPSNPGGRCIFDGDSGAYCADPDGSCRSGLRWSQTALDSLSGKCVDPILLRADMAVGTL